MNETLSYIDSYFNGALTAPEQEDFEARCASDPAFAEEVAFYVASRRALKEELHAQKRQEFSAYYQELSARKSATKGLRRLLPLLTTAAAACLLLFLGWRFFLQPEEPQRLADAYIEQKLQTLSVTMGSQDSLQRGIAAYNRQDYAAAEGIFSAVVNRDPEDALALQYLGTVYLVQEQYDKAITSFDALARRTELYANPGLFYKAVALMKRSGKGDREAARMLLEEVVRRQLPGNQEATAWLKEL